MANDRRRTTVQSLQRGLEILVAVAQSDRPLGITELSRQFGLAKGSISRLVATLTQLAFLIRDPETAKYQVSMKVWELGNGAMSRFDIRAIARPVMEELSKATQETVHLTILTESDEMVFLDKLDSTRAVRPNVMLGTTLPAYCVANGKAMLAFLPKPRVDRVLRGTLRKFTDTTITRKSEVLKQLDNVRRNGYAVNYGEYRADVSGLAAPICNHTGNAVAVLGISVPSNRMTTGWIADLAPRVVSGARQISHALGYRGEPIGPATPEQKPNATATVRLAAGAARRASVGRAAGSNRGAA